MSSDSEVYSSTRSSHKYAAPLAHKNSCKYCHGMIADGLLHEECKSDFEWEQKMKQFNAHWRPAEYADYMECL
ncbi:aminomethyltransferase [Novimethylophilus kurashikiensis]|uniref:Aminomethyltransferase n=1 Tax=Novimethylophilus kurashikiensis TaxID=1825523 RepID=A0A2R5F4B3_9PROT|nr:hypothetical protein [Novimethylophilus kurashikiensis]GBG13075.1 aminomethyltransferase [Novimethylophilus kurashikiensis]